MGSIFDSGYHKQYNFDNGYGASVIWNLASYGHEEMLFEVAVIDLETDDLCYDTPVTDDVVGFLDFYEVVDILDKIKNLPAKCRTNNTVHCLERTCEFNVVEEFVPGNRANICECSNCRYRCAYGFIVDEHFKYCPNCGALVRKVVEHD